MNLFQEEKADVFNLIQFIKKHLNLLIIIGLTSGVLAAGVTAMLPQKFSSSAKFFPPNYKDSSTIVQNSRLGIELHTDRLIELLRSKKVKERLIQEFDLYEYYEIDSTSKTGKENIYQEINKDVSISRTSMLSVIVLATTKKPKLSAEMANSVVEMTNSLWADAYREIGPVNEIYVVEKAQVSHIPVSPSYLKNIGITVVGMIMMMIVVLGFYEKWRSK